MSRTATIKGGSVTWVGSGQPNMTHDGDGFVRLKAGERVGQLWKRGPRRGAVVLSATLYLTEAGPGAGVPTFVALDRLAAEFEPETTTWATAPGVVPGTTVSASTAGAPGDVYALDVTADMQAVAAGEDWFGWQITTDNAAGHRLTTTTRLVITYAEPPEQCTGLTPSHGAVSYNRPTVGADYDGDTELAAIRVEVASDEDFTALVWDSGVVPSKVPVLSLDDDGTFLGIPEGVDWWWRISVQDADGQWSPVSEPGLLRYVPPVVLTIVRPNALEGTVTDYTPEIEWSATGGEIASRRIRVEDPAEPGVAVYDTGRMPGGYRFDQLPPGTLVDQRTYRLIVTVWDTIERESVPFAPAGVRAEVDFVVAYTPTEPAVDLTVTDNPDRPGALLRWTRVGNPDHWVIERDGKVIEAMLWAEDTQTGFEQHTYIDSTVGTKKSHTYRVRAVVDGLVSEIAPEATWTHTGTHGLWIGHKDAPVWVRIIGTLSGISRADRATVHTTLDGRFVREVHARLPYSGTVAGELADRADGYDVAEGLAALEEFADMPTGTVFRLVGADFNLPVTIGDVSVVPADTTTVSARRYRLSLSVWEHKHRGAA